MGDAYNYTAESPLITEQFVNPFPNRPFINEMEENYGDLMQFKGCVEEWSFGVSYSGKYICLYYREVGNKVFLPLNAYEKIAALEIFHTDYIVIGLQAVNSNGSDMHHFHSIVIKIGDNGLQFNLEKLLNSLPGTLMEDLRPALQSQYLPWSNANPEAVYRKVNQIFQALDRFVMRDALNTLSHLQGGISTSTMKSDDMAASLLTRTQAGLTIENCNTPSGASARLRIRVGESPSKRPRKQRRFCGVAAGSSESEPIRVRGLTGKSIANDPEYLKFHKSQDEFWRLHKDCFLFSQRTFVVDIARCVIAKDEYIIRKLEDDIVKSVATELLQMGDIKQRQKVCLTPVDSCRELLQEKPRAWDDIKDNEFMIINGQHSITASKILQTQCCGEKRREELTKWDAYIVWALDPVQLHNISKFYNSTNHLNHAQPTWGNQLISARNIWLANGRPTDKTSDLRSRQNGAIHDLQKYRIFSTLVVSRFQNINPEKDGATVKGVSNLKSEIRIITLADNHFGLWMEFLNRHQEGSLINPDTLEPYNRLKTSKPNQHFQLTREFFKYFGHFTDEDLRIYVEHLLGITPNRDLAYPKCTVRKPSLVHGFTMVGRDWVERRKRKRVVLEEFVDLDPTLKFIRHDGSIDNEVWRRWKQGHLFSAASWNVLLNRPSNDYYRKRLTNEGKLKRATELRDKIPEALPFFSKFLSLKNDMMEQDGCRVQLREQDAMSLEFIGDWEYDESKKLGLGILDLREVPGNKINDRAKSDSHFYTYIQSLCELQGPSMMSSTAWVWIIGSAERAGMARAFVEEHLSQYECLDSYYYPSKQERLYDIRASANPPPVGLIFLIKKDDPNYTILRSQISAEYRVPILSYYHEAGRFLEARYRMYNSELRMEIYLELLKKFCNPGENFFGVHTGLKSILAAKMYGVFYYGIIDKQLSKSFHDRVDNSKVLDINDFMQVQSPYQTRLPKIRGDLFNIRNGTESTDQLPRLEVKDKDTRTFDSYDDSYGNPMDIIHGFNQRGFDQYVARHPSGPSHNNDTALHDVRGDPKEVLLQGGDDVLGGVGWAHEKTHRDLVDASPTPCQFISPRGPRKLRPLHLQAARRMVGDNLGILDMVAEVDSRIIDLSGSDDIPDAKLLGDSLNSDDDVYSRREPSISPSRVSDAREGLVDKAPNSLPYFTMPASYVARSDDFQNVAGKAPFPESIVVKEEGGWWKMREERKKWKAEEMAARDMEIQRIREAAELEIKMAKDEAKENCERQLELLRAELRQSKLLQQEQELKATRDGVDLSKLFSKSLAQNSTLSQRTKVKYTTRRLSNVCKSSSPSNIPWTLHDSGTCQVQGRVDVDADHPSAGGELSLPDYSTQSLDYPSIPIVDLTEPHVEDSEPEVAELQNHSILFSSIMPATLEAGMGDIVDVVGGEDVRESMENIARLHDREARFEHGHALPTVEPEQGNSKDHDEDYSNQIGLPIRGAGLPRKRGIIDSSQAPKWLNIALEINGILCECIDSRCAGKKESRLTNKIDSTLVGPKRVYIRPGLRAFLSAIGKFTAEIVIWSSMERSTVAALTDFLFDGLPWSPYAELGQEDCTRIETSHGRYLTSLDGHGDVFLKMMDHRMFDHERRPSPFNKDNTLLIDDSPEKSVCNETGNGIFLRSWTDLEHDDLFFEEELLPWLLRLHLESSPGHLRGFVDKNRIGRPPLAKETELFAHMVLGMKQSAKNLGNHYDLRSSGGTINPR